GGWGLEERGRSICYITDNEIFDADSDFYSEEYVERLADFVRATDVLITDCTYTDAEYPRKIRWGHSSASQVAEFGARARPKALYLVHHDPDQSDAVVDAKVAQIRDRLGASANVVAPAQLDEVQL